MVVINNYQLEVEMPDEPIVIKSDRLTLDEATKELREFIHTEDFNKLSILVRASFLWEFAFGSIQIGADDWSKAGDYHVLFDDILARIELILSLDEDTYIGIHDAKTNRDNYVDRKIYERYYEVIELAAMYILQLPYLHCGGIPNETDIEGEIFLKMEYLDNNDGTYTYRVTGSDKDGKDAAETYNIIFPELTSTNSAFLNNVDAARWHKLFKKVNDGRIFSFYQKRA